MCHPDFDSAYQAFVERREPEFNTSNIDDAASGAHQEAGQPDSAADA